MENNQVRSSILPKLRDGTSKEKAMAAEMLCGIIQRGGAEVSAMVAAEGGVKVLVQLLTDDGNRRVKDKSVVALSFLTIYYNNHDLIVQERAISPLVKILSTGGEDGRGGAAIALGNLALNSEKAAIHILQAGALDPLVLLLSHEYESARAASARALYNIAKHNDKNKVTISNSGAIGPLVRLLASGTPEAKVSSSLTLIQLLSVGNNRSLMVAEGAIRLLVPLLAGKHANVQEIAACLLANIVRENPDHQIQTANEGAIKPLVQLLSSDASRTKEMAVLALASIMSSTTVQAQLATLEYGLVPKLVRIIATSPEGSPVLDNACRTLTVAAININESERKEAIKSLAQLLFTGLNSAKLAALIVLGNMATQSSVQDLIVQEGGSGVVKCLVTLLDMGSHDQRVYAARVLVFLAHRPNHHELLVKEEGIHALLFFTFTFPSGMDPMMNSMAASVKKIFVGLLDNPSIVMQQAADNAFKKFNPGYYQLMAETIALSASTPSPIDSTPYQLMVNFLSSVLPPVIPPVLKSNTFPNTHSAASKPLDTQAVAGSPPITSIPKHPLPEPVSSTNPQLPNISSLKPAAIKIPQTSPATAISNNTQSVASESSSPTPPTSSSILTTAIIPPVATAQSPTPPSTPSTIESASSTHSTKSIAAWLVTDVLAWISTLGLSKDYASVITENHITGPVLLTMTKEDWKDLGIIVFGDVRTLLTYVPRS